MNLNDVLSENKDIQRIQDTLLDVLKVRKRAVYENIARDEIVRRLEDKLINSYLDKFHNNPEKSFLVQLLAKVNGLNDMDNFGFAIYDRYASDNKLENRLIFDDNSDFYELGYDDMLDAIDEVLSHNLSPEQFIEKYASIFAEIVESKIVK